MQSEFNLLNDLKHRFQSGGMHMRLLFVNAAIFLCIGVITVLARLMGFDASFLSSIFALDASFDGLITQPWGLITSIFAHFSFFHFLFNMLFLYFAGSLLESYFGAKRVLSIYILGGVMGGIFEIIAHEIFPGLVHENSVIVGASGSIMAIFIALAFYRPNLEVMVFGILPVKMIILAALYLISDFVSLGLNDGTAHFAHLGGAIFGILSIRNPHSSRHFLNKLEQVMSDFWNRIKHIFGAKKPKMTVTRGGKTDYDYNAEKKARQDKTDAILDKISKSGYESLTKAEKDFLFNQSKNG